MPHELDFLSEVNLITKTKKVQEESWYHETKELKQNSLLELLAEDNSLSEKLKTNNIITNYDPKILDSLEFKNIKLINQTLCGDRQRRLYYKKKISSVS